MAALDELDKDGNGVSVTQVRIEAGMSGDKAAATLHRLVRAGIVEKIPNLKVQAGKGASKQALGVRRVRESE